jgi:hypothetical protein
MTRSQRSSLWNGITMHLAAAFDGADNSNGLPSDRAHDRKSKRRGVTTRIGVRESGFIWTHNSSLRAVHI